MTRGSNVWTIEVLLDESTERTEAEAIVEVGGERIAGWGRARRNPRDPDIPKIGEELAAARALAELSHRLLERAADAIEAFEGTRVQLHP
jgi:hypothetical protein